MTARPGEASGHEPPVGFRVVEISSEPVELYKILKFEGLAGSGGEAKLAVASGYVLVNGKVEMQKRKKIVSGDNVEFNGDKMHIRKGAKLGQEPSQDEG